MSKPVSKIRVHQDNGHKVKKSPRSGNILDRITLILVGIMLISAGLYFNESIPAQGYAVHSDVIPEVPSEKVLQETVEVSKKFITTTESYLRSFDDKIPGAPPVKIIIPGLEIDIPVKKARIVKGYWEVFGTAAGWGEGTAAPEENRGNQVIFAHARPGLFYNLKRAKLGQKIYVFTDNDWFGYEISNIIEVDPSRTDVIAPTLDPTLTLFTCTGNTDEKRLIVTAKKSRRKAD